MKAPDAPAAVSPFGHWTTDDASLPVYAYTGTSAAPYFWIGNHRITLFTHVDGRVQILTGERSWMRMNHLDGFTGGHRAVFEVDGAAMPLTGSENIVPAFVSRRFGCGFAAYESEFCGVRVERVFATEPDMAVADALPGFVVRIRLTNHSPETREVSVTEEFLARPLMLLHQWLKETRPPVTYSPILRQPSPDQLRLDFRAELDDPHAGCFRDRPARCDAFPPSLVFHAGGGSLGWERDGWVRFSAARTLAAGESAEVVLAVALASPSDEAILAEGALAGLAERSLDGCFPFREEWASRLPVLSDEPDPVLRGEMRWHAHTLEVMATHSSFYGETFIPQGTNYDYSHAFTAAPRDHMQHALGVLGFHPELAKSILRYCLQKVTAMGEIIYTDNAVAMTSNELWHTSDQQLYLFYAINEYLLATGDYAFLTEKVRVQPVELGAQRTVFEQIERAFCYLRDEVRTGLKGLPRILNSDWNDGIFYNISLRYPEFCVASSHANAGMAAVLLPALADHLEAARPHLDGGHVDLLVASIRKYREAVTQALLADMEGRTFARRAYLGDGSVIGEHNIFLEPQPWLLMLPEFDRKAEMWETLRERLCSKEPLGSRAIEHPVEGHGEAPPGETENAAFWHALHGQLISALVPLDPAAARSLLKRASLNHFAEILPEVWYGQWSGSDTHNSILSDRPGMMTSLDPLREVTPVPCAHAHAYPLFCHQKILQEEKRRASRRPEAPRKRRPAPRPVAAAV